MFYSLKLFYIPEAKASHLPLIYILFEVTATNKVAQHLQSIRLSTFAVNKTANIFFIFFLPVNTGDFKGSL